jgi:hypothetical protein
MNYSQAYIEALLRGVWNGEITEHDLPEDLYESIVAYLKKGLYQGFGITFTDLAKQLEEGLESVFDQTDFELLTELRENVYLFSSAKTYQQIRDMRDLLTGKDGVREWSEFKEMAGNIFDQYNENWLAAEYSTAIGQAQNAVHWNNIEKNKELLPYLQYEATEDELECEICTPFNNVIAPVDDPIWDVCMPENHYRCFTPDTRVLTEKGWIRIDEIKEGDLVIGGSGKKRNVEATHINNIDGEMLTISIKRSSVTTTKNHRFLTVKGWVMAEKILPGDVLVQNIQAGTFNKAVCAINNLHAILSYLFVSVKRKWKSAMVYTFNTEFQSGDINVNEATVHTFVPNTMQSIGGKEIKNSLFVDSKFFMKIWIALRLIFVRLNRFLISSFSNLQIKHWVVDSHSFSRIGAAFTEPRMGRSGNILSHNGSILDSPLFGSNPLRLYRFAPLAWMKSILGKKSHKRSNVDTPLTANHSKGKHLGKVNSLEGFTAGQPLDRFNSLFGYLLNAFLHRKFVVVRNVDAVRYSGQIYNLSVNIDESYITNVGVVHNCRCTVLQIDKYEEVELTPDDEKDELINNAKEVMDPVFQMNAGKDRVVFNENHPYFSVAKGDKGFAKENFGLSIPETD